jgi:hypothetical protein
MNKLPKIFLLPLLVVGVGAAFPFTAAHAVEGGSSNYLLGMKGPLAAFVPKPGVYLTNNVYFYDAGRDNLTPLGNRLVGDVSAKALTNIAQVSWVTEQTLFGGRLALSGLLPYGNVDVAGTVTRGGFSIHDSDSVTAFGDPVLGGSVGWKDRNGDEFRAWSVYGASVWCQDTFSGDRSPPTPSGSGSQAGLTIQEPTLDLQEARRAEAPGRRRAEHPDHPDGRCGPGHTLNLWRRNQYADA